MPIHLINGDALKVLSRLPSSLVNCVITSPPYWGLRDYSVVGQIGLESTYSLYVERMVEVFREVRRVLRMDGTLWLNLGDSYSNYRTHLNGGAPTNTVHRGGARDGIEGHYRPNRATVQPGLKEKDLCGIPWRIAFALQADGWYLRQDLIWHKPNPMPESIRDRCTKAHEYLFLLTKSARYYYDAEAIKEEAKYEKRIDQDDIPRTGRQAQSSGIWRNAGDGKEPVERGRNQRNATYEKDAGRNKRSVWTIATAPFPEAHFATFPPSLVEPCVLAGCPPGGLVLDPFAGAGTVGLVASRLDRNAILVELSKPYCEMAARRLTSCSVSHYTLSP